MMKKYAIIVAGGKGARMGSDVPKQFLPLDGKPVLMHTIEAFYQYDKEIEIIVVLPEDQMEHWNELKASHNFIIPHRIVNGGPTRFHSVKNGLWLIEENSLVAIHDGVRALISPRLIEKLFSTAAIFDGAYPVIPVSDTLRRLDEAGKRYILVNREQYRLTQTPQVFRSEVILPAYHQNYAETFTDDVSVVEKHNSRARIEAVEGSADNIKITRPEDLAIAQALLRCRT